MVAWLSGYLLEHLDCLGSAQEASRGVCCYPGCSLHVSLLQELVELLLIEIVSPWEIESRGDLEGELIVSQLRYDIWHQRTLIQTYEEHLALQRDCFD